MALFDLPLDQLKKFNPPDTAPADFDSFWAATLAEARKTPLAPKWEPNSFGLKSLESFDVTFQGFGGHPIKGWLNLPKERAGKIPCIVEFIGYGGGRGFAWDWLLWPSLGYAHFIMDTRGQGSDWSPGATPDPGASGAPQIPGFMTRGIMDPQDYYYRRVFTDAARAVEAAASHPALDPSRLAVAGTSQGGGISIAAAGLSTQVAVVMPDVPFLCHYRRANEISAAHPYQEISKYLQTHRDRVEQVFSNLAYFDGIHFAPRSKAQALYSVGLMDEVCPPSTVYAAYNRHQGPKQIRDWHYNHHEGGQSFQVREKIKFLTELWPL